MKIINTMEKWDVAAAYFLEKGYKVWQMQYSWDHPDGFHAWLFVSGNSDIEICTHNEHVQNSIIKFNSTVN